MTKAAPHTLSDSEKASCRRKHAEQFKDKAENVWRRHMFAVTVEKRGRTDRAAGSVDVCRVGRVCVGSVCAGSVCAGSVCAGSVCVGSVCAGSVCAGSGRHTQGL